MITPERIVNYKKQALAAITAKAKNPSEAGIACVTITPHDLLDLILAFEALIKEQKS